MRWSMTSDRRVVEAIVATFRDSADQSHERLSRLRYKEWLRTCYWLDGSGMALYFLDRLQLLGSEGAMPAAILDRLRQNLADNKQRTASLLAEFTSINSAFQTAGIRYCNLKGFTLSPDSCSEPHLRSQLDLDLLIDGNDRNLCRQALESFGYTLAASTPSVWEFKAGYSDLTRIEDHYKPRPQRSVELHFDCATSHDPRLDRLAFRTLHGLTVPTLSGGDQFVAQALHLFKHLRSTFTRLAWLLEYRRHISTRYDERSFWAEVRDCASDQPEAAIAIGAATLISTQLFGGSAPAILNQWTLDCLPPRIRLWVERYGRQAVLADFPGTKLYLILEDELNRDDPGWHKQRRNTLLPLRRVPPIIATAPGESITKRIRRNFFQFRFSAFRLHFHLFEGLRYYREVRHWKRMLSADRLDGAIPPVSSHLAKGRNL